MVRQVLCAAVKTLHLKAVNVVHTKERGITAKVILSNEYVVGLADEILGKFLLPFSVIGKTRSGT